MPTHLIKDLENTVDRFSPDAREKLKDGTYDYMGLTRDYV